MPKRELHCVGAAHEYCYRFLCQNENCTVSTQDSPARPARARPPAPRTLTRQDHQSHHHHQYHHHQYRHHHTHARGMHTLLQSMRLLAAVKARLLAEKRAMETKVKGVGDSMTATAGTVDTM